ncbi:hypothetical protein SAMN05444161_3896 [Rhizobiales bacterium GAS191]|nr:hypothetical protein SAMN05444161_3896 [Rhizobiales bacterium GAS191]
MDGRVLRGHAGSGFTGLAAAKRPNCATVARLRPAPTPVAPSNGSWNGDALRVDTCAGAPEVGATTAEVDRRNASAPPHVARKEIGR